jgi:FdhD protein
VLVESHAFGEEEGLLNDQRKEPLPITAAVLAGGIAESTAATPEPSAENGQLLARVVDAVMAECAQTLVVARDPDAIADARLPTEAVILAEEGVSQGLLGELVTAMVAAEHEWVLAVSGQASVPEPGVIGVLWAARHLADVVALADAEGLRPLPALYRVAECLPAARSALATGRRRLNAIFATVRVAEVSAEMRGTDSEPRPFHGADATSVDPSVNRSGSCDGSSATSGAGARSPVDGPSPARAYVEISNGGTRAMPSERPVTIYLNDVEIATTQATPRDLEELAVGFLVSEGLLVDRERFGSAVVDVARGLVYVTSDETVPEGFAYQTRYLTSGCGSGVTFSSLGHARGLEPVDSALAVTSAELYELVGEMARAAALYRQTGGMHACGLARCGELVLVREDVGRHNALDKLLGQAWLDEVPTADAVLLSTGRISYEMAVKAAKARIPIVATRSAVTDLAADIGDELGITLVGYVRGGKLTVYTHPHRVLEPEGDR